MDPLTARELAQMTDEEIAALSQEQSDATLNKMAQLFQDGEKQELDEYLSALGFATTYEEYAEQQGRNEEEIDTDPSIQPMWQSDYDGKEPDKQCHEALTAAGFLVYLMARNELFNGGSSGFQLSDFSLLSKESAWPDKVGSDQVGFIFKRHFYDPDGMDSYTGSKTNTPRTNGQLYYDNAVMFYKSGNRTEAIKNLAYSIHYIQDVAVPHHAANKVSIPLIDPFNRAGFEELASQMLLDGQYEWDIESSDYFNLTFYNTWAVSSVGVSIHNIASTSKRCIDAVTDKDNLAAQIFAAYGMLGYSMSNTSGVLYKFAKEVGAI